ncbi:MAG: gamma-glutamyl-gamma-aminobutyrate hydrolase family protein [Chloroflexi bacterium]|nr:gamma-glutamyl-gamma-aminobutyrate hydrolase family protein [Chloroflexota bacterium]
MPDLPRIGVTRWDDVPPEARDRYWARIREAGGEVIDLDESAAPRLQQLAPTLDALLLTGGIDVDPGLYGAHRHAKVKETAPERDRMELAYLRASLDRDIPVLAICRGHQLLNVGFGGTLLQHIDSGEHRADFASPGYPSRWHDVTLAEGSLIARALEGTSHEINSRHHQAVHADLLGRGLRATGYADDHGRQLIEAMESETHAWVVGVQWHPERPEHHHRDFAPSMRRLFEAFVRRALGDHT